MIAKPKVTIIMATFNRADFIVESLRAIQNQIFTSWECLIIDDGSTDATQEVVREILDLDVRFSYHKRPSSYPKGPSCRNYGLDLAQGDYIIFFDDDDIPHPQNLELCVKELDGSPHFFCRYVREVFHTETFSYQFDYSTTYTQFPITVADIEGLITDSLQFNCCAVLWKKECFATIRFASGLMYAEDWELAARIVASGYSGISINKTLFYGRKHLDSSTGRFFKNDPIRRESFAKATLLAVAHLQNKNLITFSLKKYFVIFSYYYKDFDLFEKTLQLFQLDALERVKWRLFYFVLPLRIAIYSWIIKRKKQKLV